MRDLTARPSSPVNATTTSTWSSTDPDPAIDVPDQIWLRLVRQATRYMATTGLWLVVGLVEIDVLSPSAWPKRLHMTTRDLRVRDRELYPSNGSVSPSPAKLHLPSHRSCLAIRGQPRGRRRQAAATRT